MEESPAPEPTEDERREAVRSALNHARATVETALENLDTYDEDEFDDLERVVGGILTYLPPDETENVVY